jgi:hypothetical protein
MYIPVGQNLTTQWVVLELNIVSNGTCILRVATYANRVHPWAIRNRFSLGPPWQRLLYQYFPVHYQEPGAGNSTDTGWARRIDVYTIFDQDLNYVRCSFIYRR